MNIANSQVQRRLRVLYTGSRSSKCHWVAKRVKKWLVSLNDHVQAVFIEKCEEEIFWQKYWCTILSGIKMYKMEMSASHGPPGAGTYSAYGQFEFFCLPEPLCLISGPLLGTSRLECGTRGTRLSRRKSSGIVTCCRTPLHVGVYSTP